MISEEKIIILLDIAVTHHLHCCQHNNELGVKAIKTVKNIFGPPAFFIVWWLCGQQEQRHWFGLL